MQLQHVQLPRWALATLRCTPHVLPGEGGAEGTERIGSLGGLLSLCSCSNNILQLVGPPCYVPRGEAWHSLRSICPGRLFSLNLTSGAACHSASARLQPCSAGTHALQRWAPCLKGW